MNAKPEPLRTDRNVLRMPPVSVEAEQSVLGALLFDGPCLWRVTDLLTEDDFYRRDHRLIYRAILALSAKDQPFDVVTLGEWLEANGLAEQIGGTGYLVELTNTTPSSANVRAYAEIVREKALLRQLIEVGTEAVNDGFKPAGRTAGDVLGEAAQRLENLTHRQPMRVLSATSVLKAAWIEVSEGYSRGEAETGLLTGFTDLDECTAGLQPEDFVIVAARPGIGKTVLALNLAANVAQAGKRVAVWSLEMSAGQLGKRLLSSLSGVPHAHLKRPWTLEDEHWPHLTQAAQIARSLDLQILDAPDLSIEQLEGQAHQLHGRKPLDLIVIDYLGLMNPPKAERHELAMGEISRRVKKLAKRLRVPIVGVHQLNRGLESRSSKEPTIADLRDTGRFEQDADMIWLLHRESYYTPGAPEDCQLHVAKQRSGETKRLGLGADLARCRFLNFRGQWVAYVERKDETPAPRSRGYSGRDGRRAAGGDA
jgi:replicative DNA helicase